MTDTTPTKSNETWEQKQFERLGKVSESSSQSFSPINKLLNQWLSGRPKGDWMDDAEWTLLTQRPIRAQLLLYTIIGSFFALLIWSAFAQLDEVARGDGKVIPSRQLQTLQSLDGGIIEDILVREGQLVEAGELLIKIDPTRFVATLGENRAQQTALTAQVARLQALINGLPLDFPSDLKEQAPLLITQETRLYESSLQELNEQQSVYNSQIRQKEQQLSEAKAARSQYQTTLELTQRELNVTRPLLSSGAVSDVDILRLERDVARLQGEYNRAGASVSAQQAAVSEAVNKKNEVRLNVLNRWQEQLAESASKLDAISQVKQGLEDKVRQADIRAPVRGTIQRLHVTTEGGVATPGSDIVDIVPIDDQLVIEARIPPKDIAFIHPEQKATLRFSAYDFSVFGGLQAQVTHISADTITDENDNTYYLVRLETDREGFSDDLLIIPGMTAQVDIITGKKTVLAYLMRPVIKAGAIALTER